MQKHHSIIPLEIENMSLNSKKSRYSKKSRNTYQKNHGGVYAEFLRRQTPLPSGKREKSPCSTTNFLYTRKMSSEAPQFKISGV